MNFNQSLTMKQDITRSKISNKKYRKTNTTGGIEQEQEQEQQEHRNDKMSTTHKKDRRTIRTQTKKIKQQESWNKKKTNRNMRTSTRRTRTYPKTPWEGERTETINMMNMNTTIQQVKPKNKQLKHSNRPMHSKKQTGIRLPNITYQQP